MKTKNIVCFILSLLLVFPCLFLSSCDSASVGDFGSGLSTEDTREAEEHKTPHYTPSAKYKELAKDDTVYYSGIYTGYSIIMRNKLRLDSGTIFGSNLCEIMLDHPGEVDPVHEDPTCSHDSLRCPTATESMSEKALIVRRDGELPIIFYFGIYEDAVYTEDGDTRPIRMCEVRGYDVETGEYTTVASLPAGKIENAVLFKGKIYMTGGYGVTFGMVDIVTGVSKVIEPVESYEGLDIDYNEYNILGIENDRLYYMHVFGEMYTEEHPIVRNFYLLKSCSLDLGDVKTEYDFGDLGTDYDRGKELLFNYSYMDGSEIYFLKNNRFAIDPEDYSEEGSKFYHYSSFEVCDIYALDLDNKSEGEKLILKDVYKCAFKNGKMYYTLVDYKELGSVSTPFVSSPVSMFASTDGGTVYEYDLSTGGEREVCRDSGYNIEEMLEVTDDGKLFFAGYAYCDYEPDMDGYTMYANYNVLDISTGKVTPLYSQYKDISAE